VFGLSLATLSLVFLGALAVSVVNAALRREPAWALALAFPALLCADRAGLPSAQLAWLCALYALAIPIVLIGAIVRGGTLPIAAGLLGLMIAAGISPGTAKAGRLGLGGVSLHQPPVVGLKLGTLLRRMTGSDD
jgi:hypothetical protein